MFESFFNKASIWLEAFVNVVVDIINRVISYFTDVIGWFKSKLKGARNKVAYIIKVAKLMEILRGKGLKGLFDKGNVKVITNTGIYEDNSVAEIVHDEQNDKITDLRLLGSDQGMDVELRDILDSGDLVKLT